MQEMPLAVEDTSLIERLAISASVLWKDWPRDMKISFEDDGNRFSLTGKCPHCSHPSVFTMPRKTVPYGDTRTHDYYRRQHLFAMLECSGCYGFILGIIVMTSTTWEYKAHYPVGKPSDDVSEDIPPEIAVDFKEALRCRWVDAYNATVEMCRRALESSCLEQKADPKLGTLQKMIDWIHSQGKITTPLRDMAHKIRLGGDRGAHPSERIMGEQDADAVLEFTREYFDHVYVMPKKMEKFDFSRPKPGKT